MERVTDEELVRLARNGDPAAFDEIVERHKGAVFRAALSALRNREDAEDVTQETFITAYRKLDSFRGESRLRTWLSRIAWNRSMDHRRRGRFRSFLHLDEPDAVELPSLEADPERATLAASAHARVRREIDRLPETLRDTLLLASAGDLDYASIAEMLGVREGTVKSRVFEARAMVRLALQEAAR
ncbi:MAG TPA: sigma-70 family RNA polymerase sigma factor [Vicinamibacteria bacterium]|nr:sigma-70 family RNA polymerase sigma factor [Vicinamibacteria bacterium]